MFLDIVDNIFYRKIYKPKLIPAHILKERHEEGVDKAKELIRKLNKVGVEVG